MSSSPPNIPRSCHRHGLSIAGCLERVRNSLLLRSLRIGSPLRVHAAFSCRYSVFQCPSLLRSMRSLFTTMINKLVDKCKSTCTVTETEILALPLVLTLYGPDHSKQVDAARQVSQSLRNINLVRLLQHHSSSRKGSLRGGGGLMKRWSSSPLLLFLSCHD